MACGRRFWKYCPRREQGKVHFVNGDSHCAKAHSLEFTYTCSAVSTGGGAGLNSPVDRLKIKRCNRVSPVAVIADRTTVCVVATQTLQLLGEVSRHVRRCR